MDYWSFPFRPVSGQSAFTTAAVAACLACRAILAFASEGGEASVPAFGPWSDWKHGAARQEWTSILPEPSRPTGKEIRVAESTVPLSACTREADNLRKIASCTAVINSGPGASVLAKALNSRGRAYQAARRHSEAIRDFSRLIGMSPDVAAYYDNRQASFRATGDLSAALRDADMAVRLADNSAFVFHSRASILLDLGRPSEAVRDYQAAIARDPKPAFRYYDLARALMRMRDYSAAEANLDIALQKEPGWVDVYKERALSRSKLDRNEDARADALAYLEKYPEDIEVAALLAILQDKSAPPSAEKPAALPGDATPEPDPATVAPDVSANSGKRVALVIGNGGYIHAGPLRNPRNDAQAMARMLDAIGFDVIEGLDLDREAFAEKIRAFGKAARASDLALVFYAGHGLQVNGTNYLVPVNATVEDETALDFELVNVDTITAFMGGERKVGILLLDACRNNPFTRSLKRGLSNSRALSVEVGLAPIGTRGGGLLVGYATAPGDVAADGNGADSPFTIALLKHLPTPDLEINTAMIRVRADVADMTRQEQRPWTNSDLTSEVYLVPRN